MDKTPSPPILSVETSDQEEHESNVSPDIIPIGITGLEEILFPDMKTTEGAPRGFVRPNDSNVVPRVILIKGIPGCGKSLLSIKMMLTMVQHKCQIHYVCLNDTQDTVLQQITSFGFCETSSYEAYINQKRLFLYDTEKIVTTVDTPKNKKLKHIQYEITNIISKINEIGSNGLTKIVFIDSINVSALSNNSKAIRDFIKGFKFDNKGKRNQITFLILEDYFTKFDNRTNSLIAEWEYLSDIVIELGEELRQGYQCHYAKVNKKHFGPHSYGKHLLKIAPADNPFSNIEVEKGVVVYPSVHKYLSRSLQDTFTRNDFVHTGISHLDSLLKPASESLKVDGKSIPPNACFVIQSENEGYHLALGLNILWGGLWKIHEEVRGNKIKYSIGAGKDVLLISLAEENNIEIFDTAIAHRTHLFASKNPVINLDNGKWIEWRYHNAALAKDAFNTILKDGNSITALSDNAKLITSSDEIWQHLLTKGYINKIGVVVNDPKGLDKLNLFSDISFEKKIIGILKTTFHGDIHYQVDQAGNPSCNCSDFLNSGKNEGQKVIFNKWCAYILDENGERQGICRKMIVASFRPGCITPEQFIYCINKILSDKNYNFSRILFNSTAHLGMRYPLLKAEDLFVPSLIDLFKSKNVVSIFIDPVSEGSHKLLSHTLEHVADYFIKIKNIPIDNDNIKIYKVIEGGTSFEEKDSSVSDLSNNIDDCRWSEVIVENLRGNNYARSPHAITSRNIYKREEVSFDVFKKYLENGIVASNQSGKIAELWNKLLELGVVQKFDGSSSKFIVNKQQISIDLTESLSGVLQEDFESDQLRNTIVNRTISFLRYYKPKKYNELFFIDLPRKSRKYRIITARSSKYSMMELDYKPLP